tara:strand:+ start:269 stop:424 length:156 start_codon:yes stop_codon:yes gene_type:complete
MINTKKIYLIIVIVTFSLLVYDHLTSPVLPVSSPGQTENSCAPCGAPCKQK